MYEKILERQNKLIEETIKREIDIKLPDGNIVKGQCFVTTPFEIARKISKKLAEETIVAKVKYSNRDNSLEKGIVAADEDEVHELELKSGEFELWDMGRPLQGDCEIELVNFEDPAGKMVIIISFIQDILAFKCAFTWISIGIPLWSSFMLWSSSQLRILL